jgi:hypothetical protein
MTKRARGEVRRLLAIISEVQGKIGMAKSWHDNDRSRQAHENGQNLLNEAFQLCLEATSDYDPADFDPALMDGDK